jgi:Zn-dependent protease
MLTDTNGATLLIIFISLVISITLHEAMHAFTGYWLGDDTAQREGRISLNPIRHIDPFMTLLLPLITLVVFKVPLLAAKPVPFNPARVKYDEFGAALVGLAGPFTNLLLALAAAGIFHVLPLSTGSNIINALVIFIEINIALFVFNMIPFPPLDGSRLLYALAPEALQKAMYRIEMMGFGILLLFLIIFLPIIGPFIVYANTGLLHLLGIPV